MEELTGTVEDIIFHNEQNGYTVFTIGCDDLLETVCGSFAALSEGQRVTVRGDWEQHREYGLQFKAVSYEIILPRTIDEIEQYLASGMIRGVGPSTARAIVDTFGEDALDIMEMAPQRLCEVPGIGRAKADQIAQSYAEIGGMRKTAMFLQRMGISNALAAKIMRAYGTGAEQTITVNPYQLVDDIDGVGFKTADMIAEKLGIAADDAFRVCGAMRYVLSQAGSDGNMFLPKRMLSERTQALIKVRGECVEDVMQKAFMEQRLVLRVYDGEDVVYLPSYYAAESQVAARLALLSRRSGDDLSNENLFGEIGQYEKEHGITLAPMQQEAIRTVMRHGVAVITGGPGTGKTTIINCMILLLKRRGLKVALCAPTGRAAKRMADATGEDAKTIHRLLEYQPQDNDAFAFSKGENEPLDCHVCIVDETSMIDIFLMKALLSALAPDTRLVLVGDADQLPSVGAGNVLRDMIDSEALPVVRLTEIFRQETGSLIVSNAHRINRGEMPDISNKSKDFFFESHPQAEDCAQAVLELCARRLPGHFGLDPMSGIQVLCPQKKGDCGVIALNKALQRVLNPPSRAKAECMAGETLFRQGDKVMQVRNNYQIKWSRADAQPAEGEGIFNGDMGFITEVHSGARSLTVAFEDGRVAEYDGSMLEDLMLAYAISVHKSQGCEFPVVVMPLVSGPQMLYTRNLLYTGVTRARRVVMLLGRRETVAFMVQNNLISKRYCALSQYLKNISEVFHGGEKEHGDIPEAL